VLWGLYHARFGLWQEHLEGFTTMPNKISGAAAGYTPEFIEMIQSVPGRSSGAAQFRGR
jgi:hypothetical protein